MKAGTAVQALRDLWDNEGSLIVLAGTRGKVFIGATSGPQLTTDLNLETKVEMPEPDYPVVTFNTGITTICHVTELAEV